MGVHGGESGPPVISTIVDTMADTILGSRAPECLKSGLQAQGHQAVIWRFAGISGGSQGPSHDTPPPTGCGADP